MKSIGNRVIYSRMGCFVVGTVIVFGCAFGQDTTPGETKPTEPTPTMPTLPTTRIGPENPLGVGSTQIPLRGDELRRGWSSYLTLGLTGNSNESKKVIGRADGNTTSVGTKILANMSLREERSDWRNNLSFVYASSKDPYIPEYVKSEDNLGASSLYIYRLPNATWFGPFVRAAAKTTTSLGRDVRSRPHDYVIAKRDGTFDTRRSDRIKLNDAWKPTILKETLGGYFELYGSRMVNVEILAGAGARQVYAKDQLVSIDNPHTDEIELLQLNNSKHFGPEAILQVHGLLVNDLISYSLVMDALFPSQSSGGTKNKLTGFDRRIIETDGTVSLKLTSWLALDYTVTSLRDRDLSDDPQMSSTVQFNASYVLSR